MLQATWHILPIAIAVAVSSVPIMATILILLSPNRARSALPSQRWADDSCCRSTATQARARATAGERSLDGTPTSSAIPSAVSDSS